MTVVVLAGGSGGAKLARGMLDVAEDLVVIANSGDDVEIYEAYVSPDPDLCTWWLADEIDPRGWGLAGDTFNTMDGLRRLGVDVWFNLGDHDLAVGLERRRRRDGGETLTQIQRGVAAAHGVEVPVLPMCEEPVRTRVKAGGEWWDFQEFMIRRGGSAPDFDAVEDVALDGIDRARATPEVLEAVAGARAIVIGPSNPIISIDPILGVGGLREALVASPAAVVAVSPVVGGHSVKGPTEGFLAWAGRELSAAGIGEHYRGVVDGVVTDEAEAALDVPTLTSDTLMTDSASRRRVAEQTLDFALALAA